jgi:hypothetical protein
MEAAQVISLAEPAQFELTVQLTDAQAEALFGFVASYGPADGFAPDLQTGLAALAEALLLAGCGPF